MWEKPQMGENPRSQVGTENPIHMQGSNLGWDSNQGPQRWKAQKDTTWGWTDPFRGDNHVIVFSAVSVYM